MPGETLQSESEGEANATAGWDASDWAWEFLRRNPDYHRDWLGAVPRVLPILTLHDGTRFLRLRRRYPRAEAWGLFAFADPRVAARAAPVFWHPTALRRTVRARGADVPSHEDTVRPRLGDFGVGRSALAAGDGGATVLLKGNGTYVALAVRDLPAVALPIPLTFELDRLDDVGAHVDCLKTLQRFADPAKAPAPASVFGTDDRLRHTLMALDGFLAGKTYRQIAMTIFGEKRVAEEWAAGNESFKDRTRRLVARGRELMQGGYRDLLR